MLRETLAKSITEAQRAHSASAQPLPAELKRLLADFFPKAVLDRARVSEGSVAGTLPTLLNRGAAMLGYHDHAVTVDNIIVFSKTPGFETEAELHWWAHELQHVTQYTDWGVSGFAANYLRLPRTVEADAEQTATRVADHLRSRGSGN